MKTTLMFLGLVISLLPGCSRSAQLVRKDALGGVIALEGAYVPAMEDAQMLMVEQSGGRFDMREQGERLSFHCRDAVAERRAAGLAMLDAK